MVQVSANDIALILLPKIHCIVNRLLQKRSLGIKDKEINELIFLTLESANFFFYWFYVMWVAYPSKEEKKKMKNFL